MHDPARWASRIVDGLWMSRMPPADADLPACEFTLVVSLADHLPTQAARRFEWGTDGGAQGGGQLAFLHWPIADGDLPDGRLLGTIVDTVVGHVRAGGRVLVHCLEGRNRSGLVAALAVRQLTGCDGAAAVQTVRHARPGTLTNQRFATALASLAAP